MIWVPDPAAPSRRPDVRVMVAVQSEHRLYVLVEAPASEPAPQPGRNGWHLRVRAGGEEPLFRTGGAEYGGRGIGFITATYNAIDPSQPVEVAVELNGEVLDTIRLVPVS